MRTRCHTADSCGALSRTANLLGVIHGHRDAKVGAQSVWLLTAQRQQRIKAPEADTLNTMINPKGAYRPGRLFISPPCGRESFATRSNLAEIPPLAAWCGSSFLCHRERVLTGVCIRRRAQMTLFHCLQPSHHLRRAYTSSPSSPSSYTPLSTSP